MTAISRAKTIDESTQNQECTQSALPMQETEDIQVQKSGAHGEIFMQQTIERRGRQFYRSFIKAS